MLFRRKSIYVKLNMLKFIPKTEYGQQTGGLLQGAFSVCGPMACETTSKAGVVFLFLWALKIQEVFKLKKSKIPKFPQKPEPKRRLCIPVARIAYTAFLCMMLSMMFCQPAFAATDIWTKAKEIMQDVYNQILLISTVAAIVTASVALMMNFSRSGRTVDESRAWLKRICITWAILNGLGFIMAYITPFFSDGKWTG